MIIGKIIQKGLLISLKDTVNTFQYSANLRMQFVKDENFKDYILTGYYKTFGENKPKLLEIDEHGYFYLGKDIFLNAGTVQFSFSLNHVEGKIIHLGIVEYIVERAFGSDKEVLPEDEEIWVTIVKNAAKDTIKDDVELVKQKANEALQSASLANEKVSEAQKYANNANQSASSVLTAKNDAIAASSSAIQAKKDAEQSANNAKDSANTALENANRSSEAIATATQIETEIENKANDFDKKVETANSTFDEKVSNANKEIDPKVQEVIKQAQKAKDEADRATQVTDSKLDKNLGAENCDKVLITDTEGNIITQNKKDFEGSGTSDFNDLENKPQINGIELKSNKTSSDLKMYTQEEVDYLLNDKMDKPYISVTIGEDAVLNDCLDGNLKVDSIEGYSLQDNTSPSPTIPSEVKGVDKINIRTVGKNLFDSEKFFKLGYQKYYRTFLEYENGVFQVDNQNEGGGYVELSRLSELNIKAPFVFSVELNSDDCQAIIIAIGETGAWVKQFHCTKATNSVSIKQDPNVDDYMIMFKTSVAGHKFEVSNIQIEQGESATDYEPYIETRLDYTLDKPLRELPNGVKDTVENGVVTRRVGEITFDGSEAWNRNNVNDPNNWLYYLSMSHGKADGLCNSLMHEPFNIVNKGADLASVGFNLAHNEKNIFINVGYYMEQAGLTNTVADLKTWLQSNPITVWYELATPTIEPITEELLNALKKLKTFAPVTNVFIGGEVKPTIVVKYPQDILTVVNRLESRLLTLQEEAVKNV